jgi:hypothetical protein
MRLQDFAVLADHVGDAARVFILLALRRAVGEADLAVGVAEEGEGEVEFLGEVGVRGLVVEADTENLDILFFVFADEVAEPATLQRSAGGIGLRIEPEDHALAAQVAQTDVVAVVIEDVEIGCLISNLKHLRRTS